MDYFNHTFFRHTFLGRALFFKLQVLVIFFSFSFLFSCVFLFFSSSSFFFSSTPRHAPSSLRILLSSPPFHQFKHSITHNTFFLLPLLTAPQHPQYTTTLLLQTTSTHQRDTSTHGLHTSNYRCIG